MLVAVINKKDLIERWSISLINTPFHYLWLFRGIIFFLTSNKFANFFHTGIVIDVTFIGFLQCLDQVSASINQEWRRLQRRKHLRVPCPSSPEMSSFSSYSPGSSPPRKEQPLFTLKQVTLICERMLKEREAQVTEEYDKVLREKLAG